MDQDQIIFLQKEIVALKEELYKQKTTISQLSVHVEEIRNKVLDIFKFLPNFIRRVSTNFLRLLVLARLKIELEDVGALTV
jgi:hypothetical protein